VALQALAAVAVLFGALAGTFAILARRQRRRVLAEAHAATGPERELPELVDAIRRRLPAGAGAFDVARVLRSG
jgi:hypothetical protein